MKGTRLGNICRDIFSFVRKKEKIGESHVLRLAEGMAPYDGREAGRPNSYVQLKNEIDKMWHYGDVELLTKEQAFIYGGIWGCLQVMEAKQKYAEDRENRPQQLKKLTVKYSGDDKKKLLGLIRSQAGIRHENLLEKMEIAPAQVSRMLKDLSADKMITCNYAGGEKFYFLSERGEEVYRRIKKREIALKGQAGYIKTDQIKLGRMLANCFDVNSFAERTEIAVRVQANMLSGSYGDFWSIGNSKRLDSIQRQEDLTNFGIGGVVHEISVNPVCSNRVLESNYKLNHKELAGTVSYMTGRKKLIKG